MPKRSKGGGLDWYRYYNKVVKPHLILEYRRFEQYNHSKKVIFMQDGAGIHEHHKTLELFKREGIEVLEWPGNSPNLNPIEHI
jgi:transposase